MNLDQVLARIKPTAEESQAMQELVGRLERAGQKALTDSGADGQATVQGSLAKGTWLRHGADADLFLLLDPSVPLDRLDTLAGEVADKFLSEPARKYAQHPYIVGRFESLEVDLVPAYQVKDPETKMSAVDRTPFHTAWVNEHLDDAGRDDVRCLKQWLKGIGGYGAETAIGGFSGYLVEVLAVRLGGFEPVLQWMADGGPSPLPGDNVAFDDPASHLLVSDPVDGTRNCAAAVTQLMMDHVQGAARAYLAEPSLNFFFPKPATAATKQQLEASLEEAGLCWMGVLMTSTAERLDIVFPQFQKAARAYESEVNRAIPTRGLRVDVQGQDVLYQFLASNAVLPAERRHQGPAATAQPNAKKFASKWNGHPDAAGPVREEDGFMVIQVIERHRTAAERLWDALGRVHVGKHVKKALPDAKHLSHPGEVPEAWAPLVADFALQRQPWER